MAVMPFRTHRAKQLFNNLEWLKSFPVIDATGNGRAQPTGKFGSMGLLTKKYYQTIQTAAGGNRAQGRYLEVTVRCEVTRAGDILRACRWHHNWYH